MDTIGVFLSCNVMSSRKLKCLLCVMFSEFVYDLESCSEFDDVQKDMPIAHRKRMLKVLRDDARPSKHQKTKSSSSCQSSSGNTAALDVVRCLLEAKANLEAKNNYKNTALKLAALYGRSNVVQYLSSQSDAKIGDAGTQENMSRKEPEIPEDYECPLTFELMVDPVINENGETYALCNLMCETFICNNITTRKHIRESCDREMVFHARHRPIVDRKSYCKNSSSKSSSP